MKVKITADSTCDLSQELVDKYNITIIPLTVIKDDKSYLDGKEISSPDVFKFFNETGRLCSTAAVNIGDYTDIFTDLRKEYDEIVHFSISSDMSSCYRNACLAAEEIDGIYPVDARNLSTGIGLLVLDAAEMAQEGKTGSEIQAILDEKKNKLNVSFVLDTLTYLAKGGRCSTVAALGANLLGIKPCIEVKEGKMGVGKKYRGPQKKVVVSYVEDRLKDNDNVDYSRIFITDSGISDEVYNAIYGAVTACGPFKEVLRTQAGCTISSHCGPNCLGILYYNK